MNVPNSAVPYAIWSQVAQLLTSTLPGWDAWCPDDGRLATGLAIVVSYLDGPASDLPTPAALAEAYRMISDAYAMVNGAVDHTDDAATWRAWNLARQVYILISTLMDPPQMGEECLLRYMTQSLSYIQRVG